MAERCSFCGSATGPFSRVEGLFAVLICVDCLATRGHGTGPYPAVTRAELRASLNLLPTWVLETKAAANRRVIAAMRRRLAAGEQVARMYQEPGWRGWSGKPRSPRTWSPSGRQPLAATTADLGSPTLAGPDPSAPSLRCFDNSAAWPGRPEVPTWPGGVGATPHGGHAVADDRRRGQGDAPRPWLRSSRHGAVGSHPSSAAPHVGAAMT
jgi:hypothetical protein